MAGEITTVDIKGLKELDDLLKSLPEEIQRRERVRQARAAGESCVGGSGCQGVTGCH